MSAKTWHDQLCYIHGPNMTFWKRGGKKTLEWTGFQNLHFQDISSPALLTPSRPSSKSAHHTFERKPMGRQQNAFHFLLFTLKPRQSPIHGVETPWIFFSFLYFFALPALLLSQKSISLMCQRVLSSTHAPSRPCCAHRSRKPYWALPSTWNLSRPPRVGCPAAKACKRLAFELPIGPVFNNFWRVRIQWIFMAWPCWIVL